MTKSIKTLHSENWYLGTEGICVSDAIKTLMQVKLSKIFGYYAIEMGVHTSVFSLLEPSRIKNNIKIFSEVRAAKRSQDSIVAEPEFLPIVFDNIDLVIASHVFESSQYPHQVLREIDRVLVPEGHCLLIGFNPYSRLNLFRRLRLSKTNFKEQTFRSAGKMRDWLKVLGFEIISTHTYGYRPSIENKRLFNSLEWLDKIGMRFAKNLGDVYVIHAQKTDLAHTPTVSWKTKKILTRKPAITAVSKEGNSL